MGLGQDLTLFAGPGFYRTCGTDSFMLRPGLVLQLSQLSPTDPLHMEFEIQSSPLIFGFMLTGSNHCSHQAMDDGVGMAGRNQTWQVCNQPSGM